MRKANAIIIARKEVPNMKKWWDEWGPAVIVFTGIVVLSIIFVNWIADKPIGDFIFFVVICIIFFQFGSSGKLLVSYFSKKHGMLISNQA